MRIPARVTVLNSNFLGVYCTRVLIVRWAATTRAAGALELGTGISEQVNLLFVSPRACASTASPWIEEAAAG